MRTSLMVELVHSDLPVAWELFGGILVLPSGGSPGHLVVINELIGKEAVITLLF
jgi:hypothetical protein